MLNGESLGNNEMHHGVQFPNGPPYSFEELSTSRMYDSPIINIHFCGIARYLRDLCP
jgi:hypothetical protein